MDYLIIIAGLAAVVALAIFCGHFIAAGARDSDELG